MYSSTRFDLGDRWILIVIITPRPLYPRERNSVPI